MGVNGKVCVPSFHPSYSLITMNPWGTIMKIKTTLFITLLLISNAASADYPHNMGAGVLRADCELLDRPSQVRCEAFLMGVADTVNALTFSGKLHKKYLCIPEGVNEIRLRQVFVEFVAAENVRITDPAADVALGAFGQAFSCN